MERVLSSEHLDHGSVWENCSDSVRRDKMNVGKARLCNGAKLRLGSSSSRYLHKNLS